MLTDFTVDKLTDITTNKDRELCFTLDGMQVVVKRVKRTWSVRLHIIIDGCVYGDYLPTGACKVRYDEIYGRAVNERALSSAVVMARVGRALEKVLPPTRLPQ